MTFGKPAFLVIALLCSLPQRAVAQATGSSAVAKKPAVDSLGDPLPPGALLRLGTPRFRHPTTVNGMALSPDEKSIVTIGDVLIVWDTATGKELWRASAKQLGVRLPAASYGIRAVAFAPDGRQFYTPSLGQTIAKWDVATGHRRDILIKGHQVPLPLQLNDQGHATYRSIDVSPDGRKLALGSAAGVIMCDGRGEKLFEFANKPVKPIDPDRTNRDRLLFGGHYSSGQFSPDGTRLAVVTSDAPNEIKLLDAETGGELRRIKLDSRLVRLSFSPDGSQIAATERDSAVRLYDASTGNRAWSHTVTLNNPYENYTCAIAFTPDGKTLAVAATDKFIHLLDTKTGEEMAALRGHVWYPWNLAFKSDGSTMYSSGWDGSVRRWNLKSRQQLSLPEGVRATGVVAISPDSNQLAYEDDSGKIRLIESATAKELRVVELPDASFSELTFSPNSQQLAAAGNHGDQVFVAVWDLVSGHVVHRWGWPKGRDPHSSVTSLSYSPDGNRLAAAVFRQDAVHLWDLNSDRQIAQQKHGEVYGLSFSPDGETLATFGWDSKLMLWDSGNGKLQQEVGVNKHGEEGDDLRMYAVAYSPQLGIVATQHMNGQVWIWDAAQMKVRAKISAGSNNFGAMRFSPDGLWMATGTRDGSISLWETLTGREAHQIDAHQDSVDTIGFGGDGRVLVSGGGDGVCYLWDLMPPDYKLKKPLSAQWDNLSSDNAAAAYDAMWAMSADPDKAIAFLAEKLRGVTTLIDPDEVGDDNDRYSEEAPRRQRLQRLLIERDPAVESRIVAQRAIATLARFDSPEATQVLEMLASKDSHGDLARLAADALADRMPRKKE